MSKIVRGTMLLTGATFLSKILGMLYVIPFNQIVGPTGGALYFYAYTPYNILISISTVGVPLAVSKFVSKYNSLGDYQTGLRMFRAGIIMMSATGIMAFLALFFSADILAPWIIPENDMANSVADVAAVIKMVSFALLIIPVMSLVRGFFQGYESMGPTAISQVTEQIVRIAFVLISVSIVIYGFKGSITTAVGFATFAAFIGALASCAVLWIYWRKRKSNILLNADKQKKKTYDIPTKSLFVELFQYAGPFILVGIATPLYQLVDEFTFNRAMGVIGQSKNAEVALSAIGFYGHKLIIIPVTIATGLSLAILPALTKTFTQHNRKMVFQQINQALQIVLVLVIPAAIGLMMLADVAYGSLFGMKNLDITGPLLGWYAPVSLLFALFTVSSSILQGINEQRFAVISLSAGLLIKVLFNTQLIYVFGAKGAIFGTALAVGTAIALNLWHVHKAIQFSFKQVFKRTMLIFIFSIIMIIAIWIIKLAGGIFLPYEENRAAAAVMLFLGVGGGGLTYLWFAYKSTLLERTLGERVHILGRIFK